MSKQNIKNIAILIVAIIVAACFNLNLDTSVSIRDAFTSVDSILLMSFFLILFIALKQIVELKDKRARIVSVIVAVIFAGLEVIGYSISSYNSLAGVIGSKEIFLKAVLKFIGYAIVFYTIIIYVYTKVLPKIKLKTFSYSFSFTKVAVNFSAWIESGRFPPHCWARSSATCAPPKFSITDPEPFSGIYSASPDALYSAVSVFSSLL